MSNARGDIDVEMATLTSDRAGGKMREAGVGPLPAAHGYRQRRTPFT
jgi:hypothetical protein